MVDIKQLDKNKKILDQKENKINVFVLISLVFVSLFISQMNYLLFHTGVHIFMSIVAYNILIISINSYKVTYTGSLLLLGIAYGFIGGFEILHALTYEGIEIFGYTDINVENQLWVVVRYLEVSAFLTFVLFYDKKIKYNILVYIYTVVSVIALLSIFHWNIIPSHYINDLDFALFRIINVFIICVILSVVIYLLNKNRKKLYNVSFINYKFMILIIVFTLASEILFAFHIDTYNLTNILAHIFKILSFYLLFKSINESYIVKHQKILSKENNQLRLNAIKCSKDNKTLKEEINRTKLREMQIINYKKVLESILESVEEGIVLVSTKDKKKALHWNDRFLQIWDIPKELIQEKDIDKITFYVKDQLKNPDEFILNTNEMYNSSQRTFDMLEFKDGRLLERYSNCLVVNGQVIGKVLSFRDITERKKAEEIKKENEINKRLLKEERKYDEMKTQFFTNLSHELKTPINVLLGNVQLLKVHFGVKSRNDNSTKIAKYLSSMWQNCYRLLRLINNLTDIVRIDSGYFDVSLKNYNIISIVEEITLSVAVYIENMGINLVFDTDTEEKIIACDPDKIERILLNLLSNAVKFTDKGGSIIVNMNVLKDHVRISVKDTGIGIPDDKQYEIFDRFKKVNEDLVRNYNGTGIGLSLVKCLVEMHEGTIKIKSSYGDGSEFIIELPSKVISETNETSIKQYIENDDKNIEKLNIEFSDIYS